MAPRRLHVLVIAVAMIALCGAQNPMTVQLPDQPGKPETCPTVMTPWFDAGAPHSTVDFRAERDSLIAQFVTLRTYHGCLNAGLNALIARWRAAGALPNQIVIDSVTSRIRDGQERFATAVARFNGAVDHHDERLDKTDPDYVPELGPGDVPVPAAATSPDHLNLVAFWLSQTRDCSVFYPPSALRRTESGRVYISYDVGADNAMQNVRISQSSGHDDLDAAALACVAKWRAVSAIVNDVPVASPGHMTRIEFKVW